jgi:predicted AAA+ superfamily ATPase
LYKEAIDPNTWYANYIRTYIERDVRLVKNINNLLTFERFLRLCAGRVGQLFNMNSLALEVGVDAKTINTWIGILETTFVAFRLPPYHKNFNKRLVKMPKLYFYDTGLAAALLSIENSKQLELKSFRWALFENFVILDLIKRRFNQAKSSNLFFWRDSAGNELDLLIDQAEQLIPIEVKSGQTVTPAFFKGLNYWQKLTGSEGGYVIYAGNQMEKRSQGRTVLPYTDLAKLPL